MSIALPKDFSKKEWDEGKKLFAQKRVGQILFAAGTYQVAVRDLRSKKELWPFLQLQDSGAIADRFCTCKQAEKTRSCRHLAAAWLKIFNGQTEPLHIRFERSLWNELCQTASRRHGYDIHLLRPLEAGGYESVSTTGKRLFSVHPLTEEGKKRLVEIIAERVPETEETSLKFSNLPPEEIALWKGGRPSHPLRYTLSFWSDLAKWWMGLQEEGAPYTIRFSPALDPSSNSSDKEHLPKWIHLRFPHVEAAFYIAEVNWPKLIPALATVSSPLSVHEFAQKAIRGMHYDIEHKALHIDLAPFVLPQLPRAREKGLPIGEWLYLPGEGFYPAHIDPLLLHPQVPAKKIGYVLSRYPQLIQKHLQGEKIHTDPIKPSYSLAFDASEQLCIETYLFERGDLRRPSSALFGPWAYIEGKGFHLLENPLFDQVYTAIAREKISDFVTRHRLWLSGYEGFQPHMAALSQQLFYRMTEDKALQFYTQFELTQESESQCIDCGDWLYLHGKGFYPKMVSTGHAMIKSGLKIIAPEIGRFLHIHREELEHVTGFFTTAYPIEKGGLNLAFNVRGQIVVTPTYLFKESIDPRRITIFGDFFYWEKEGFGPIAPEHRLPQAYAQEKVIDPLAEPYFVAYEIDLLRPFILTIDPKLCKPQGFDLRLQSVQRNSAKQWLLKMHYESENGAIDAYEIWRAVQENKHYLFSSAGLILLRQPRFNWLKGIPKDHWEQEGQAVRLSTLEWIRLGVFEIVHPPLENTEEGAASRALLEEFAECHVEELLDLQGLKSHLRPYQEVGVRWLWFLYCNGLSGLLCDEMGLGKTHQAMALLAAVWNARGAAAPKFLVVCPTSVVYHWKELLDRFLPDLRICVFYGLQRSLDEFSRSDTLLTSYGTLRSEREALSALDFEVAIFDEVQMAKNVDSQTHKTLRRIKAKMRLGLTGTPIENRLLELKALFDIVLPHYLPSETAFREIFISPIEKSQDPEKKGLLSQLIKPFILRRKKSEVLLELPEKTESLAYCDLSEEQKRLYKSVFLAQRDTLIRELADSEQPTSSLHVFSLLSTLKQICDHPSLFLRNPMEYRQHASGKWDLFLELLSEARESNQKVVVFSQYLGMLDIIESYLREQNIGYAGIRGATRDRAAELERFRTDPSCEVFAASLQAAGAGIDLISASVVIHYDRWWNPAKENQATDRVHRMGQTRGVQVFKLLVKNTIEEHIHHIIERKLGLFEQVVGFDPQDQLKGIDRTDLLELLEKIQGDLD